MDVPILRRKQHQAENISEALAAVLKRMTSQKAQEKFRIPKSVLYRHMKIKWGDKGRGVIRDTNL